jgi:hypothetical protein
MRRATVTLTDELERAVDAYIESQPAPPTLTAVVQAALRDFLAAQSPGARGKRFSLTPAEAGSGDRHTSRDHDRVLAEILEAENAVNAFLNLKPGDTPPTADLYRALIDYFMRHGPQAAQRPMTFRTVSEPCDDPYGSVEHDRYVADAADSHS